MHGGDTVDALARIFPPLSLCTGSLEARFHWQVNVVVLVMIEGQLLCTIAKELRPQLIG
ncbi:uncharacterized protein BO80DRAFT_106450 [Aspergillus ibericus CBS 121593]|uniref:Uncharacterized protein n=1 Tax=Aspergillus ibericus CBS 121593 TaxID=1448316 RepID=A0A395GZ78_9EURO|nr:hypothetical protein BO80DRAFT_106450 [Aspergillus ibericus CBS 121593]RAL00345.1 hypothetical protein BO80DRAFT_106450 [Aspergillus ibericus CBS 121593]